MRIEDAILHCEEVAERCHLPGCAEDHRQLAEWLKELKHRREHYEKPYVDDENPKRYLCGNCGTAISGVWCYCQHCGVRIDWSGMSDLINRQKAIDAVKDAIISAEQPYAEDALRKLPSAEPERKKGRWIEDETGDGFWICSACGFASEAFGANILYPFCPNCGAKLDWSDDE